MQLHSSPVHVSTFCTPVALPGSTRRKGGVIKKINATKKAITGLVERYNAALVHTTRSTRRQACDADIIAYATSAAPVVRRATAGAAPGGGTAGDVPVTEVQAFPWLNDPFNAVYQHMPGKPGPMW